MRGGERVSRRPSCPPPHSRQAKAGQQPPSSTVRVGSSPGPHSGGPWGQVVALQTAGEAGAVGVPLPPCPSPAASPCDRASPCGGREGALSVSPPVLLKSPGSPEVVTSFLGGERSSRRRPHLSGPVALRQDAAGPAGRSLGPPPSSARSHPPGRGARGSPHSVSEQHGLSAWGRLTLTKPAWLHSGGGRWASHLRGTHCTATEPSSHSHAWQLLTHRSPGCNRPAQGPPRLPDGAPASRAAARRRPSPVLSSAGSALSVPVQPLPPEQPVRPHTQRPHQARQGAAQAEWTAPGQGCSLPPPA